MFETQECTEEQQKVALMKNKTQIVKIKQAHIEGAQKYKKSLINCNKGFMGAAALSLFLLRYFFTDPE